MKKFGLILFVLIIMAVSAYGQAEFFSDTTDIPKKYSDPVIYERSNIRLTLNALALSPINTSTNINTDGSIGTVTELCFKVSDTIDQFIRAGTVFERKLETDSGTSAAYSATLLGYGVRFYLSDWLDFYDATGIFNLYAQGGIDGYDIKRTEEDAGDSPSALSGTGVYVGLGLEIIYTPFSTIVIEANYQRTSIKEDDFEIPYDGFTFSGGVRLELF